MLYQIVSFLLEVASGLLTSACLLRLYMQRQRVPFANPVGQMVLAFSDWLVLLLRKILPAAGRWDSASLVAAALVQLGHYLLLWLLLGGALALSLVPALALFGLLRVALWALMALVLVYALLSWVPTRTPIASVMGRLCEPLLAPLRRLLPAFNGIDLSPLVLLVLLQVLMIVVGHLQVAWT